MILPGQRAIVFDGMAWNRGKPAQECHLPATIVCNYGRLPSKIIPWHYDDLVDVVFDHNPNEVSKSHFTSGIQLLCESLPS